MDLSIVILSDEKAVSVAEKKPEKITKTISDINKGIDPSGIM